MSSSAADDGDAEAAKTKGKISMAMSLIGIFSTIILVIVIVVYFVVIVNKTVNTYTSYCGYYC